MIREIDENDTDFHFNWDCTLGKRSWVSCVYLPTKQVKKVTFDSGKMNYWDVAKLLLEKFKRELGI